MGRAERNSGIACLAPALLVSALAAACSDIYYDHREGVAFQAGNAVAANAAVQTIDPWPPLAAERRIPGEGQRVQSAIARYRENKVTPLQGTDTSSVNYAPVASGSPAAATGMSTEGSALSRWPGDA